MTREELVKEVHDGVTSSGMMPLFINTDEIYRIIRRAEDWFYINYNRAQEMRYFVIEHRHFNEIFKANRTILMPDCVISVSQITESGSSIRFAGIGKELTIDRLVATELLFNRGVSGDLVALTSRLAYLDLLRSFYPTYINFDFNYNSKKLVFMGRMPNRDAVIKTFVKIENHFLYNDPYFIRYCIAESKLSTARVLGTFDVNLPGGTKFNKELFSAEGNEERNKLIEEIQAQQTPDLFLMVS